MANPVLEMIPLRTWKFEHLRSISRVKYLEKFQGFPWWNFVMDAKRSRRQICKSKNPRKVSGGLFFYGS